MIIGGGEVIRFQVIHRLFSTHNAAGHSASDSRSSIRIPPPSFTISTSSDPFDDRNTLVFKKIGSNRLKISDGSIRTRHWLKVLAVAAVFRHKSIHNLRPHFKSRHPNTWAQPNAHLRRIRKFSQSVLKNTRYQSPPTSMSSTH